MKFNTKCVLTILICSFTGVSMAQDKFKIIGNLPQAGADKMVVLTYLNAQGKPAKDSTMVKNGKFEITGTVAFGMESSLQLKSLKGDSTRSTRLDHKNFYLEKGTTVVTGRDRLATASISGTQGQTDYLSYHAQMDPSKAQYDRIVDRYFKAKAAKDSVELKQIAVDAKPVMDKMMAILDGFIASHPDSYFTADLILNNKMQVLDVDKFEPIYKALSPRVLSSPSGKKITEKFNKAKQFAVGKVIDFTLPDVKGKEFKLSSLKGKYVLVDFWASWCAPCRAENPYLLKAYKELKDKNFEIVGVSLDDEKDHWLKAVAADKLPWVQVSDVKGFKTEVAVRFGITAIPQNVLLDPDGKVIAKDLRGADVNAQIAAFVK